MLVPRLHRCRNRGVEEVERLVRAGWEPGSDSETHIPSTRAWGGLLAEEGWLQTCSLPR